MILNRTIGVEMEGYIDEGRSDAAIDNVEIGTDGSLDCYSEDFECDDHDNPINPPKWYDMYGVELRTDPITDISILKDTWKDMQSYNWTVNTQAGTHIHVDISDYTNSDKVRLLRFGKGIELIIFMFVKDYRNENEYCQPILSGWRTVFRADSKYANVDWDNIPNAGKHSITNYINENFRRSGSRGLWNGKYQWLNVLGSSCETAEFRLYHAVEDHDELIKQIRMSEAIINLVKNSTLEHLEFIIKELYKQPSIEAITDKFFEVLGLDFKLDCISTSAVEYMEEKLLARKNKKAAVV